MQIEFEIEYYVNAGNAIGEDGSEDEAAHGCISEHPEQEEMKGNSSTDLCTGVGTICNSTFYFLLLELGIILFFLLLELEVH